MAIFVTLVEHEAAVGEISRERIELTRYRIRLGGVEQANVGQAAHVRLARLDVVGEELAVEQHVVAGKEAHDARVGAGAGLLPEEVGHWAGNGEWEMGNGEWLNLLPWGLAGGSGF